MNFRTIFFLGCHVPGTIICFVYMFTIYFFIRHRSSYGSAFYTLFIFGGFVDITTYLIVAVISTPSTIPFVAEWAANIQRTPTSTVWQAYSPFLSIFFSLNYFLPNSQDCINITIAVNRLTAISMPAKHRRIWTNKLTRIYLLIIPILALCMSAATIGHPIFFVVSPSEPGDPQVWYSMHYELPVHQSMTMGMIALGLLIMFNTSSLAVYLTTAIMMCRQKSKSGVEIRLTIFGILLWLCGIPSLLFVFVPLRLSVSINGYDVLLITFYYPLAMMSKCLTPPFLLMLTNPSVRTEIWKAISARNNKKSSETSSTVTVLSRSQNSQQK